MIHTAYYEVRSVERVIDYVTKFLTTIPADSSYNNARELITRERDRLQGIIAAIHEIIDNDSDVWANSEKTSHICVLLDGVGTNLSPLDS
jgi:hypothetical protein